MNEKSEQIDTRLNILVDRDQPLSPRELDNCVIHALSKTGVGDTRLSIVCFDWPGKGAKEAKLVSHESKQLGKHAFLTAAVTFLGGVGNHPIYKKRIQLKEWYKPAYRELNARGFAVHFLGVYHYNGNVVFVDFGTKTYLARKMHNSSAFVYINDLFRAMKDGVATRIDLHGNTITTIRVDKFAEWLAPYQRKSEDIGDVIRVFDEFNSTMPFKKWLKGQEAIVQMRDASWPKWKETEWPGWYLEFKFCSYLKENQVTVIEYLGNKSKKSDALDFDLLFPVQKFYGDLKASDIEKKESPGNDQESLVTAISKFDRFWYVIYEHETVKDKNAGGVVCKFRYDLLQAFDGTGKSPTSYIGRMKNRVNFKRMMILELNRANCGSILSAFNQGHQPNGGKRAPKFLINKSNVENYQVFHYEA